MIQELFGARYGELGSDWRFDMLSFFITFILTTAFYNDSF